MAKEERAIMVRASALQVVAKHGIDNTTHTLVAAEAEVSVATILFHFPTQTSPLEAVLDDVATFLLDGIIRKVMGSVDNASDAIEQMLFAFANSIDGTPDIARVWLDWSTAMRHEVWNKYLVFYQEACSLIDDLVSTGQRGGSLQTSADPLDAAHVIIGVGHMIAQMKFTGASTTPIHRAVQVLVMNYIGLPK